MLKVQYVPPKNPMAQLLSRIPFKKLCTGQAWHDLLHECTDPNRGARVTEFVFKMYFASMQNSLDCHVKVDKSIIG